MRLFSFLCLLVITCSLTAQQVEFQRSNNDPDKYQIRCVNDNPYPYTFIIRFKEPSTFESSVRLPYVSVVKGNGTSSFYVNRIKGITPSFIYTSRYYRGCINAKPDFDYPYLLPVSPGKQTQIKHLYNFQEKHNMKNRAVVKDWCAMAFRTQHGDTIFAARRGTVCSVKDDGELEQDRYLMSTKDNRITIYHKDCTFASYSVLDEILVEKGQTVEAGQPIAITGGDKYEGGCHVRFKVSYLFENKEEDDNPVGTAYVTPKFFVENELNTLDSKIKYTSVHPEDIITKEMSKKELEKYNKSKK